MGFFFGLLCRFSLRHTTRTGSGARAAYLRGRIGHGFAGGASQHRGELREQSVAHAFAPAEGFCRIDHLAEGRVRIENISKSAEHLKPLRRCEVLVIGVLKPLGLAGHGAGLYSKRSPLSEIGRGTPRGNLWGVLICTLTRRELRLLRDWRISCPVRHAGRGRTHHPGWSAGRNSRMWAPG